MERVESFIMDQFRFVGAGREGGALKSIFRGDKGRFEVRDSRIGGVDGRRDQVCG